MDALRCGAQSWGGGRVGLWGALRGSLSAHTPCSMSESRWNDVANFVTVIPVSETPVVTETSWSRKTVTIAFVLFLLVLLPAHSQIPTPSQTPSRGNPGMLNDYRMPASRSDVIASPSTSTQPPRRFNTLSLTPPPRPPRTDNTASPSTPTPPLRRDNTLSLTTPTQPPRKYNTASPITPTQPPRRE